MQANQTEDTIRVRAIQRLKKKRELQAHLLAYMTINAFIIAIWAATGQGFFWPVFPLLGWGIGVIFHIWDVYRGEPTEDEISREMARMTQRHS
jgi:hypothetical protein